MISETEYLAPATSHDETKPASLIIFSSVKEISAEKRIRELEQGIPMHYETKIIQEPDEVVKEIARLTASSNELDTCTTSG